MDGKERVGRQLPTLSSLEPWNARYSPFAVRLSQPLKLIKTPYLMPFESRSPSNEGIDTMYCEVAQGLRPVQKKRIESSVPIGVRT